MNFVACFSGFFQDTPELMKTLRFLTKINKTKDDQISIQEELQYCLLFCNLCEALWDVREETRAKLASELHFQVYSKDTWYETDCYWLELCSRVLLLARHIVGHAKRMLQIHPDTLKHLQDSGIDMEKTNTVLQQVRQTIGLVSYVLVHVCSSRCVWTKLIDNLEPDLNVVHTELRCIGLWAAAVGARSEHHKAVQLLASVCSVATSTQQNSQVCKVLASFCEQDYWLQQGIVAEKVGKVAQAMCLLKLAENCGWKDKTNMLAKGANARKIGKDHPTMREFDMEPNTELMKKGANPLLGNNIFVFPRYNDTS